MSESPASAISDAMKERLKSNLFGAFVVVFFFVHWPILISLYAGQPTAKQRIEEIQKYISDQTFLGFWWPVALSFVAYVFVYPYLVDLYEHYPRKLRRRKRVLDLNAEAEAIQVQKFHESLGSVVLHLKESLIHDKESFEKLERLLKEPKLSPEDLKAQTKRALDRLKNTVPELNKFTETDLKKLALPDTVHNISSSWDHLKKALTWSAINKDEKKPPGIPTT